MKIDDQIRDEKLQYNISREAAKISALTPGKIVKYDLQANNTSFYSKYNNREG